MAVQRGLESAHPTAQRLFADPFAPAFVSPGWRVALRLARRPRIRARLEAAYDWVGGPGPRASAIARTRLIDDLIEEASRSFEQLMILGAGYDTRAQRLASLSGHRVYEIDHPATQAVKRRVLGERETPSGGRLQYVPVDFESDDLEAAVRSAGLDSDAGSLFLWEGVSQYLSAAAVDATLEAVHRLGRSGDLLLFTYVDAAALAPDAPLRFPEAPKWRHGTAARGEPWVFGLAPGNLPEFLERRGYRLRSDCSTREAGDCYFVPRGRPERGSELYRVVLAEIAERPPGQPSAGRLESQANG